MVSNVDATNLGGKLGWQRSEAKLGQRSEAPRFLNNGRKVGVLREDLIEAGWVQRKLQQGKGTCRLS